MNNIILISIATAAGMAIALQAGMSGQLGKILASPTIATFITTGVTTLFLLIYFLMADVKAPSLTVVKQVPFYIWFLGGLLSAVALSSIYWAMPRVGVTKIMVSVLMGQIIMASVAGHFGWFNMPINAFSIQKLVGSTLLFSGVILINI